MKQIRLITFIMLLSIGAMGQGIIERSVTATEQLQTNLDFIYRTYNIPILNVSYHEFSANGTTWRKNYVSGDCYMRFSNVVDNTANRHPTSSWFTLNICNNTVAGLDTIYVDYGGGVVDTLTSDDYTVKMTIPATITGTSTNTQNGSTHTHDIQIAINDLTNVNASPTDGQVLKYNSVSGKWQAGNDLIVSGSGGGLRVKEEDSSPNISSVTEIRVPNGHLISNGSGSVSLVLSVAPTSGENDWWRAGVDTVLTTGTHSIVFTNPLPDNNYIVANAYAQYTDTTRQNLSYGNLSTTGFDVYGIAQNVSYVHYLAIENVDSLLAVHAEIGKVKASSTDPVYSYLDGKVDNTTINIVSNKIHSIANLNDVVSNGASTSSTITMGGAHVDFVHFNTGTLSPSVTYEAGNLVWNSTDKTLDLQVGESNTTQQLGQELFVRVYNSTTSTITDGSVVYKTGRQGNVPTIGKAIATSASAATVLGILTEDIAPSQYGFATTYGQVRGLNMVGYTINAPLYLSATTAGAFTQTAPSYPNFRIKVGTVGVNTGSGTVDVELGIDATDGVVFNNLGLIGTVTATTATFGSTLSNTTFESDGTIVFNGDATVYDDIYPSSVTVGTGGSAPSFTAYNGNLKAYEFVGSATVKELNLGFQIYHSYKEGSYIEPHIHLYIPDDGAGGIIRFGLEYTWANVGSTGALSTTTVYGTVTRTASQGISNNEILTFGDIVGTGKTVSSVLMCRLFRDPTNAGDTFTPSCWLKSADVHVQFDTFGSRTPYSK